MSADKSDTLRQFCDVTGADEARSRFFLESSNWQLEVALSSFYEHGDNAEMGAAAPAPAPVPAASDSDMESAPESPVQVKKKEKKPTNAKFATLGSLQQESSSEEEEGEAFYAGGSERSGQQILGPGKGKKDIVTEVFKSVRERGAVVFEEEQSSSSRGPSAFGGVGYRLGQTADDHEAVEASAAAQPEQPRVVRLRLYHEGFTVDDGPLRSYTDPEHSDFLNCIRRGEVPQELAHSGEVRVSLEDRSHEPGPPRRPRAPPAFSGQGHTLGSPVPNVVGAPAAAAAAPGASREDCCRDAQSAVCLDNAQPTTTIQIRLADGSRITGRFNHTHTVADLAAYVTRAEPQYQSAQFALLTTYPSVELKDSTATLAAANVLNSTLLQRLK